MEKINVAELLKDCPKGMELDCYLFNGLEFDHIDTDDENYPIVCRAKDSTGEYDTHTFTKYGWYTSSFDYAKCVIFPKGKTTWDGFQKQCVNGDIVYTIGDNIAILGDKIGEHSIGFKSYCGLFNCKFDLDVIVSPARFATEEEKQKLFQAIKEHGYKWNAETKTLEKLVEPKFKVGDRIVRKNSVCVPILITNVSNEFYYSNTESSVKILSISEQDGYELVSNKFDINTLVPFESKVLVRNDESQYWIPAFWGCKRADGYTTTFGWCKYCIPFEGNEHLLETNNDCDKFYKTWE